MKSKDYVCGVLIKQDKISLILKIKGPANMSGKLNFFGGKVEEKEAFIDAMIRECKEETGIDSTYKDWSPFCTLFGHNWKVLFYKWNYQGNFEDLKSMEEEQINWYNIDDALQLSNDKIMANLKWLIPLALDKDNVIATVFDNTIQ